MCTKNLFFAFLLSLLAVTLSADFYVIPVVKEAKNVVRVAKSGAKFSNPIAAMNSINDANKSNRYTIQIEEGVYTLSEPLVIKEYVNVRGVSISKTKLIASLTGSNAYFSNAVKLSSHTMLTQLSIENSANSDLDQNAYAVTGVYATRSSSVILRDVNITAKNTSSNVESNSCALYLEFSSGTLLNVGLQSDGGERSYAFHNSRSVINVINSKLIALNGNLYTFALIEGGNDNEETFTLISTSSLLSNNGLDPAVNLQSNATMQAHDSQITGINSNAVCYHCTDNAGFSLDDTCHIIPPP